MMYYKEDKLTENIDYIAFIFTTGILFQMFFFSTFDYSLNSLTVSPQVHRDLIERSGQYGLLQQASWY